MPLLGGIVIGKFLNFHTYVIRLRSYIELDCRNSLVPVNVCFSHPMHPIHHSALR